MNQCRCINCISANKSYTAFHAEYSKEKQRNNEAKIYNMLYTEQKHKQNIILNIVYILYYNKSK